MKQAWLGGVVLAALVGCSDGKVRGEDDPKVDMKLLRDRIWIDHEPKSDTDKVHLFVVLSKDARRPAIGGFAQQSVWEGHFEGFRYEQDGKQLRVVLPQSGDRETLKVTPTHCKAFEGAVDYCLVVEGASRGPDVYFSRRGWEIRDLGELDTKIKALTLK